VVEIPVTVDAADCILAAGDLPLAILPQLIHSCLLTSHRAASAREKAVQAYMNDPHCTDLHAREDGE
jgi:hypothetical protein